MEGGVVGCVVVWMLKADKRKEKGVLLISARV